LWRKKKKRRVKAHRKGNQGIRVGRKRQRTSRQRKRKVVGVWKRKKKRSGSKGRFCPSGKGKPGGWTGGPGRVPQN